MEDTIYRQDAIKVLYQCTPFDPKGIALLEKCEKKIDALPSADRPQGDVDTVDIFEREMHNLEQGYITLGEFDERIEPLRHLCYGKPQGEWIEVDDSLISCKCSICNWESHMHEDDVYGMPYCPNCGARMKGIN